MRNKIIEALKAKFPGVSDAIINRIADKMANTVTKEEDVAASVEAVTFQSMLDSYGDSRASESATTAVSNYEKKHNIKDGKAVTGVEPAKPNEPATPIIDDQTPAWAKALIESNKTMMEKVAQIEGARSSDTRKQQLDKLLENANPAFKSPVMNAYQYMKFDSDEIFTEYITKTTADLEEFNKTTTNQQLGAPGRPFLPNGDGNSTATKEEADAIVNNMMK